MRFYVKSSHRAVTMLFRRTSDADYIRVDAIDRYNDAIAARLFRLIMDEGRHAWQRDGDRLIIFHRSTRGDFVQASYFFRDTASMHANCLTPGDIARALMRGRYVTIAA